MKTISKELKLCPYCMEKHEVHIVEMEEVNIFKGQKVEYSATYEYCENMDEFFASEKLLSRNDISMKDAYRTQNGLLTSEEIIAIRRKYDISQNDLAVILGCGKKTITRYESHQVQDAVHDTILKKIDSDPKWYLELLEKARHKISEQAFAKYQKRAIDILQESKDDYLKTALEARYTKFASGAMYCGEGNADLEHILRTINTILADMDQE